MNVEIPIAEFPRPVLDFHEGHWDEDEFSEAMDLALGEEFLYGKTDVVKVTSMGVHIGSATTHLGISRLFLRKGGKNLSSKSVVKTKEVFYESPVISTPFRDDGQIDGPQLKAFLERSYDEARLVAHLIETGVVVVSGRASEPQNRSLVEEVLGQEKTRFLIVSESSHLQSMLAALGAGAVEKSGSEKKKVLNVDLGADGVRLAWVANGSFENFYFSTAGAKVLDIDEHGILSNLSDTGQRIAAQLGLKLQVGKAVSRSEKQAVGRLLAETLLDYLEGEEVSEERKLIYPSIPPSLDKVDFVQFSGGVAEYVYGYESQPGADIGFDWGTAIRKRAPRLGVKMGVLTPSNRMRATPVGVALFSAHLPSGSLFCSHGHIHGLKNLMVVAPKFQPGLKDAVEAQRSIEEILSRFELHNGSSQPFALSMDFVEGQDSDEAIAVGLSSALGHMWNHDSPLVLVGETDAACRISREMAARNPDNEGSFIGLSGLHTHDMDFIEVRDAAHDAEVPVVVRSLVFR
jgi:ethanolamine utilization protein EutA